MVAPVYDGKTIRKELAQVFCETMEELIQSDARVVYLDADLMTSMKTTGLWEKYPKNVFNTGIQEANMAGAACGLYLAGFLPYIHTFTPFATRRIFDQIYVSAAYAHKSIRIIGSDAGIAATHNGGTHMCFEDLSLMRTIPGAVVADITDGAMLAAMLKLTKEREGVSYIRTARRDAPDVYRTDETFEIGKGKILKDGADAAVIASGLQVAQALEAGKILEQEGIHVRVIDIVTVKPLDRELVLRAAKETGLIVTTENHSIIGGLGEAVSALLCENYPAPVLKNGVKDRFGQVGTLPYLREVYELRAQDIVTMVKRGLQMKTNMGKGV